MLNRLLQCLQPRHVGERHVGHAHHQHLRVRLCPLQHALERLYGREEERAVDVINEHAWRHRDIAVVAQLALNLRVRQLVDLNRGRHAAQEVQRGEDDTDVYRHHKVGEDGQQERHQQHRHVRAGRSLDHADHVPGIAHVPGHDEEDGSQGGQRYVHRQRRQRHDDQDQHEGVHDPG